MLGMWTRQRTPWHKRIQLAGTEAAAVEQMRRLQQLRRPPPLPLKAVVDLVVVLEDQAVAARVGKKVGVQEKEAETMAKAVALVEMGHLGRAVRAHVRRKEGGSATMPGCGAE